MNVLHAKENFMKKANIFFIVHVRRCKTSLSVILFETQLVACLQFL